MEQVERAIYANVKNAWRHQSSWLILLQISEAGGSGASVGTFTYCNQAFFLLYLGMGYQVTFGTSSYSLKLKALGEAHCCQK